MDSIIKGCFGALLGIAVYMAFAVVLQITGIVDFNDGIQTVTISNWIFVGLIGMCFTLLLFSFYFLYKWYENISIWMKQKIAVEDWYPIWSHKPDAVGSIPTPATINRPKLHLLVIRWWIEWLWVNVMCAPHCS